MTASSDAPPNGAATTTAAATHATASKPKCILEPVNLHDQAQCDELLRQRKLCGWANEPSHIVAWRDAMDAQRNILFWILTPDDNNTRCAGHIGLDSECSPPDAELADPEHKTVLTISRFFVLPEHRGGGLGRAAMTQLEAHACRAPYGSETCRTVALTTLSRRYSEDDEWRALFVRLTGWPEGVRVRGASFEDWYVRMGYVKWKEAPLYEVPRRAADAAAAGSIDEEHRLVASYLRKTIA